MIRFLNNTYELGKGWEKVLSSYFKEQNSKKLESFLESEYESKTIFPPKKDIFRALEACPLEKVKVIIIGQDPYHGDGQAQGLSFSVPEKIKTPPSLRNIFKLIYGDTFNNERVSNDLSSWAAQGVLLLNSVLTVEKGRPNSHANKNWESLTNQIIKEVSQKQNKVFILWGSHAQKKVHLINPNKNLIIKGIHPSPLSAYRGFFNVNYFEEANNFLKVNNIDLINWKSVSV